ncbi:MAG: uL15 family ribosomal protein [archaeon]|nr:uL15 family ribosomal protein [archaeon]
MQIHNLQQPKKQQSRKRIGRGGKRGTYSGKGMKGQRSRSGARLQPLVRNVIKRYPKLRGYKFSGYDRVAVSFNVDLLEKNFDAGAEVTPQTLQEKQIISTIGKRLPVVKILGSGNLTKALNIKNVLVTKSAKEKIEKAGGSIEQKQ